MPESLKCNKYVPGTDIIVKDEWGRAQKIKATKGNLEMIKGWSEER